MRRAAVSAEVTAAMAADAPVLAAFMRRRVGRWCESEGVTAGDLTVEISGPAMPVVTLDDGTEVDVSNLRLATATFDVI